MFERIVRYHQLVSDALLLELNRVGDCYEFRLRDPRCSISEIAYLLGFADTGSFSRAFNRWTGQTRSQYREGLSRS